MHGDSDRHPAEGLQEQSRAMRSQGQNGHGCVHRQWNLRDRGLAFDAGRAKQPRVGAGLFLDPGGGLRKDSQYHV